MIFVLDTDSVMVRFNGLRNLEKAFEYAEEIERRINSLQVEDGIAGLFQMPMYLVGFYTSIRTRFTIILL